MFVEHWNETMRRFVNELKLNHQRKQAAAAGGSAIDCMELEDRILLSAAPIAPQLLVGQTGGGANRRLRRLPRRWPAMPAATTSPSGRTQMRTGAGASRTAVQFGRDRHGRPD